MATCAVCVIISNCHCMMANGHTCKIGQNSYVWGKDGNGVAKPVGVVGDGEMKFEFAMKPWKYYTPEDLAAGIDSNRQTKENIGLMSNGLFQHSMLLENAIFNGGMNVFWAKMLWNLYGYIIQGRSYAYDQA